MSIATYDKQHAVNIIRAYYNANANEVKLDDNVFYVLNYYAEWKEVGQVCGQGEINLFLNHIGNRRCADDFKL